MNQAPTPTWNGFVWTDHVMTDAEIADLKAYWIATYSGLSHAHVPVVLDGGATWTRIPTISQTIEALDRAIANVRRFL